MNKTSLRANAKQSHLNNRFLRTQALIGIDGLKKLQNSTVMVIGLGAVGGYALEALARSGIGHLILVDFDVFDITNINRQILALDSTVGLKKTEVAKKRVLDINPDCVVEVKDVFVNSETINELLNNKVDFVVDAIDSLNPKCGLIESLLEHKIPFISSMGAALKTDPTKIKFGSLSGTKNCGLAKFIRKRLKKRGVDISQIHCVSSEEQVDLPDTAIFQEEGKTRNTLGSLPTITAIFGLTIANEIIRKLSK